METRANFILIGAFTLAAVVAAFLFVMWIVNYGATGTHRRYQIIFNGSVTGLSAGATVRFNGLKVGEVTNLGFVKGNPSQVVADIDVTNASAPINADTKAQLETQGLTGSAIVSLIGGEKGGELTGNPPVIPSLPTATLADLQTKAGYVLDLANKLLVDNAQPIHQTIENVQTFSMALANNSGGVDAALKGLADLGKTIEPLATRLQALSDDTDKLVKAVDAGKVRDLLDNAQTFSKALAASGGNFQTVMRDGAAFVSKLNDTSKQLDTAIADIDNIVKAVDPHKVSGIVEFDQRRCDDGARESRQHRSDAQERDRDDGQAQPIGRQGRWPDDEPAGICRRAGHQGGARAGERGGAVDQEALRRRRRSGEGDFGRAQPVQQFGSAPVRGARRSGAARPRGHRPDGSLLQAESESAHLGSETLAAGISHGTIMRKAGGPIRNRFRAGGAGALALALGACASAPSTIYDLTAARPPATRPLGAQIRIGEPVATLDLDSERILVRDGITLALLPGGRWPQQLSSLFRARLVETFQNAGLARSLAGGGAMADYELDLDIRAFELDAAKSEAHVDVAARIVALTSGRVADVQIFDARVPVASADVAAVVAALDRASAIVMTRIVAFVARRL